MPTKWPRKSVLAGWFGVADGDVHRVEPLLTRPLPPPDPPLDMLDQFATPGEFLGERDAALAAGNAVRLAQMDASVAGKALAACAEPQPFRRSQVASGATLYRGPGGRRRLVIAFGSTTGLIGPPTPVFLQCIDATRWDVLILRDADQCHFRMGVAGIGRNFAAVARWLATKADKYQHVTCLGYQTGGMAAVWAGMALGADRVVCVAGQRPHDAKRIIGGQQVPFAFDAVCACVDTSVSRPFVFVAAAAHTADMAVARRLAGQTGGRAVGAVGHGAHALLSSLRQRGQLQPFLEFALTSPVNTALQQRLTGVLRSARSGTDQIPAVAKGVTPDGD